MSKPHTISMNVSFSDLSAIYRTSIKSLKQSYNDAYFYRVGPSGWKEYESYKKTFDSLLQRHKEFYYDKEKAIVILTELKALIKKIKEDEYITNMMEEEADFKRECV